VTRQARLAWALCGLCVVFGGVHTWLFMGWSEARRNPTGWPILTVGMVFAAALGALIVTRRPGHRVGWLFVMGATCTAISNPLFAYDEIATAAGAGEPPAVWNWAAWLGIVLDAPEPLLFVTLVFLLFPDGRLPSRRWRPLLWTGVTAATLFVVVLLVATPPWQLNAGNRDKPFGPTATAVLVTLLVTLILVLLGAAASVLVRLRRARGLERQQLRLLSFSASLVAVGFVLAAFLPWDEGLASWLRVLPLHIGAVGVFVGAGLAVLRYRLYDLDVVVSRAILVTTATAFVAVGYVAVVVLIGQVADAPVGGNFWPSLLATAVVALAFQPLRRRAMHLADRLAYGSRAAPYEALATFARRLQGAPSRTSLLQQVAAAIGEAVGARQVTAVLELPGHSETQATWPARAIVERMGPDAGPDPHDGGRGPAPLVFTIEDRGERLGRVEVVLPPGVSLRKHEGPLVERLLDQGALALRNLWLETELAVQVAELDRRTTALEASRRQLVIAGDEEKARFSLALRGRVLPLLAPLPGRLRWLVHGAHDHIGPTLSLRPEQEAATEALEELRRLVHGMGPLGGADGPADGRAGGQRADVSQAAVNRSGPNADFVT
jgi:hypothetical protein